MLKKKIYFWSITSLLSVCQLYVQTGEQLYVISTAQTGELILIKFCMWAYFEYISKCLFHFCRYSIFVIGAIRIKQNIIIYQNRLKRFYNIARV